MKKTYAFLSFILSLGLAQFAQGQTLDDIINKHVEAMGGRQKIITLSSALMTGTFTAMGATSPINITTPRQQLPSPKIRQSPTFRLTHWLARQLARRVQPFTRTMRKPLTRIQPSNPIRLRKNISSIWPTAVLMQQPMM